MQIRLNFDGALYETLPMNVVVQINKHGYDEIIITTTARNDVLTRAHYRYLLLNTFHLQQQCCDKKTDFFFLFFTYSNYTNTVSTFL